MPKILIIGDPPRRSLQRLSAAVGLKEEEVIVMNSLEDALAECGASEAEMAIVNISENYIPHLQPLTTPTEYAHAVPEVKDRFCNSPKHAYRRRKKPWESPVYGG